MGEGNAAPNKEEPECPERVALDHAIRRWEAESQNAERLANRENGLLTLLSALVGFGFFKLSDFDDLEPSYLPMVIRVFLTAVLALILYAFYKVFIIPRSRRREGNAPAPMMFASGHLAWPIEEEVQPHALATEEEAIRIAFARTSQAAASLHRRNVSRREALDKGQRWLIWAILTAAFGFVCYTWSGYLVPAKRAQPPPVTSSKECPK